jgi:hypothetical protein
VAWISKITVIIFNCLHMFFVSSVECSACLLCVFLVGSGGIYQEKSPLKYIPTTHAYSKIIMVWYFKNNLKIFCKYFTTLKCKVLQYENGQKCIPQCVYLMMASWTETYRVWITGRDWCFCSVNFNTSTKLHKDGKKCEC